MAFPETKTKVIATVGPACHDPETLMQLIHGGMDVARLNFSHGDFGYHGKIIRRIRKIEEKIGKRVSILADLPGPKIRIGDFEDGSVVLTEGESFVLTTKEVTGTIERSSVNLPTLPRSVKKGDALFLSDGLLCLRVVEIEGEDIICIVEVGGYLASRKGLNLPGIDLGIRAFTEKDRECLEFALKEGVDAVSQSFVEDGGDIRAIREVAQELGTEPFIIAKIERANALLNIDSILEEADGIMVARGDLGVEIPIEEIAIVQKELIRKANRLGKPVITATQMLESMTAQSRPTRAEATDVTNAILDGTDCIMLSGESATGKFPIESVGMLRNIAATTERHLESKIPFDIHHIEKGDGPPDPVDIISSAVGHALEQVHPAAIIIPTRSGHTARQISRFRLPMWITAVSSTESTCRRLSFSYGVHPVYEPAHPGDWNKFLNKYVKNHNLKGKFAILTEGPSPTHPGTHHRMEVIDLGHLS